MGAALLDALRLCAAVPVAPAPADRGARVAVVRTVWSRAIHPGVARQVATEEQPEELPLVRASRGSPTFFFFRSFPARETRFFRKNLLPPCPLVAPPWRTAVPLRLLCDHPSFLHQPAHNLPVGIPGRSDRLGLKCYATVMPDNTPRRTDICPEDLGAAEGLMKRFGVDPETIAELQAKHEAEIAGIGHVHVRALLLFQGEGAVRSMLKEKWSSMGIVSSALLLTITIPFIFEPPSFDHDPCGSFPFRGLRFHLSDFHDAVEFLLQCLHITKASSGLTLSIHGAQVQQMPSTLMALDLQMIH